MDCNGQESKKPEGEIDGRKVSCLFVIQSRLCVIYSLKIRLSILALINEKKKKTTEI